MKTNQSKIEKLISELCPNGVEFFKLSDISTVSGAGVDKKINPNEKQIKLLNYMDVYRNRYLNQTIPTMVVTANDNKIKQCNILTGDIFFTPSSEVLNDIGNSAVATEDMPGVVYSYHIMRIRLNKPNIMTSMFVSFMLESDYVQNQINKNAKGITRFGLTKTQWEKIKIPIPPIAIQKEIVTILNSFIESEEELEIKLEEELDARKKQYEYYRSKLLNFDNVEMVQHVPLSQITMQTKNIRWKEARSTYRYIDLASVSRENNSILNTTEVTAKNAPSRAQKIVRKNDVIFATTRPTLQRYAIIDDKYDNQIVSTGFCVLRASGHVLPKWIYYNIANREFNNYVEKNQEGVAYPSISDAKVKEFKIPLPSLNEQKRIVLILEKFDLLVNNISISLPAELKSRKQQYEHYRNKLLNFKEV